MTDSHVTTLLKEIRTTAGETQEQVAKEVGVSRQTIISIEKGSYTPSVSLALRLAKHFGLSVEKIFTYD